VVCLLLAATALAACGEAEGEGPEGAPVVQIEESDTAGLSRVTLSDLGSQRIGLVLTDVSTGAEGLEIPYDAVLYDADGATWTFVSLEPNVYMRQSITIDHIDGDVAYLTAGPDVGAKIVSIGANELYGAEIGVGDE
jgi:hypothetical protein